MTTASPSLHETAIVSLTLPAALAIRTAMSRGSGRLTLHARFGYKHWPAMPVRRRRCWIGQAAYANDGPEVAIWGRSDRHI